MLGVLDADGGIGTAIVVVALYLVFAFVALAVDRRALLVSSLAYVLVALYAVIRSAGAVDLGVAIAALIIGSALLVLSAFWHPMRRRVVATRSEEHTSELQSLMRISYAVFCLKKKKTH